MPDQPGSHGSCTRPAQDDNVLAVRGLPPRYGTQLASNNVAVPPQCRGERRYLATAGRAFREPAAIAANKANWVREG